ncbi:MAG TPA: RnfABCDGE type electron transport complex subunit B [Rudaea sp.]|jgi:electron transport complex protein RnfB|uniref:RnfABCDGE type electron transport complex subunit B n=1 Tax=Rudaea sp. TaxID=2136325 RepID=UPI002F955CF6
MPPDIGPVTDLLAQRIDALLPQTQCTRCGYPACLAYAQAIACDAADIDQCPPGGAAGIAELAALLGRETKPLNPVHGIEKPAEIAMIDEEACIGCTKCILVCPVDAIVGASKMMHTILEQECSGCELCIPACPVDCIAMVEIGDSRLNARLGVRTEAAAGTDACGETSMTRATQYRRRYEARETRLARERAERNAILAARKAEVHGAPGARSAVLDAIARAKAKKSGSVNP